MATLIEEIVPKEALAALDKIISGIKLCAQGERELRQLMPEMPQLTIDLAAVDAIKHNTYQIANYIDRKLSEGCAI